MSEAATLTALVHGNQVAVSFRHLSSVLNVSTRKAQNLLQELATSDPNVTALWCVTQPHPQTGVLRTALTTKPPPDVKKQIWAVGPSSAENAASRQAVWLAADSARDRKFVREPSHLQNELRDGRWNRVTSSTNTWNAKLDPRLEGDERLAIPQVKTSLLKNNSSSLLASVKAKAKGKKAKAKGFGSSAFKSPGGGSSSLFASKPLGSSIIKQARRSSLNEGKEKREDVDKVKSESELVDCKEEKGRKIHSGPRKTGKKKSSSKKVRRVLDNESEDDEPALEDDAVEQDEDQECLRILEREAEEREKADAERAELEKELLDLNRDDADEEPDEPDEPESPELKEINDANQADHGTGSPVLSPEASDNSPGDGKRSFWQTFGDGSSSAKRIRKEVEETIEENGYFVTRRVVKIFDEHGNELKDAEGGNLLPEEKQPVKEEHGVGKNARPLHPKNHESIKEANSSFGVKKEKMKSLKKSLSKVATPKKTPKKKVKGNIMSYFGKKV